jgi:hypothetical protein
MNYRMKHHTSQNEIKLEKMMYLNKNVNVLKQTFSSDFFFKFLFTKKHQVK